LYMYVEMFVSNDDNDHMKACKTINKFIKGIRHAYHSNMI